MIPGKKLNLLEWIKHLWLTFRYICIRGGRVIPGRWENSLIKPEVVKSINEGSSEKGSFPEIDWVMYGGREMTVGVGESSTVSSGAADEGCIQGLWLANEKEKRENKRGKHTKI